LFKRNWKDIQSKSMYKGTCYVRDYFRRKDKLSIKGGYKITEYLEWVRRTTIPAGKQLPYIKQNIEEVIYILQGEGAIKVGKKEHRISVWDSVYIPPDTPHTIYSTLENQPLIYMDYAVRVPPETEEIIVENAQPDEKVESNIRIKRWSEVKSKPGHNGTCWLYPVFTREMMQYILFAVMMSVPKVLSYHRHNTEAIYYIDSGVGFIKVGGEELEVQDGDAVYIPNGVAHKCWSSLEEQPLNVFCVGVAIPYDTEVWTEEDLPDLGV